MYLKALKVKKADLKKLARQGEIKEVYLYDARGTSYLAFAPLGWGSKLAVVRNTDLIETPDSGRLVGVNHGK